MQMPAGLSPVIADRVGHGRPGQDLTSLVHHLSDEPYHLKRIVLRIYWDGEPTPSVEAPIGDFFGLGLGD